MDSTIIVFNRIFFNDYLISVPHTYVRFLSRAVNFKNRFNYIDQRLFTISCKEGQLLVEGYKKSRH
jgi:hypothetical protein